MPVSNPDRCLSTRVLNQCAVRKQNKLLMFRKTDFVKKKFDFLCDLLTLNQYCLLWDFKCPQIKLISIIQKPKTNHNKHNISSLVYV